MQITPINSNYKAYSSSKTNFKGTMDPKTLGETFQRKLRNLYRSAQTDALDKSHCGFNRAGTTRKFLADILERFADQFGNDARRIAEELKKPVEDDLDRAY